MDQLRLLSRAYHLKGGAARGMNAATGHRPIAHLFCDSGHPGDLECERRGGVVKRALALVIVVVALVAVPVASSSSVLTAYASAGSAPVVEVKGTYESSKPATASAVPSNAPSQLPFTGADLIVIVGAGIALMGLGLGLRRLGHDKE